MIRYTIRNMTEVAQLTGLTVYGEVFTRLWFWMNMAVGKSEV